MPKQAEIDYLGNLDAAHMQSAVRKPFSDDLCAMNLMENRDLVGLCGVLVSAYRDHHTQQSVAPSYIRNRPMPEVARVKRLTVTV